MSGLYNLIFGVDPAMPLVVSILRPDQAKVPRLRDAWIDIREPAPRLVIYTRAGGGNRQDYARG